MNIKYLLILITTLYLAYNLIYFNELFFQCSELKDIDYKDTYSIIHSNSIDCPDFEIYELTIKSNDNCPILYNLYKGLYNQEKNQIQNLEGLRFKNKLVKRFYNIDEDFLEEIPIINVKAEEKGSSTEFPEIKFLEKKSTNAAEYLDYNSEWNEETEKEVLFDVKNDYSEDDIVNFVEYCYFNFCFGIVHIDKMDMSKSSHYRILECPNITKHPSKYYFILPERIRKMAMDEGKEYTRAKCMYCGANIIVYFKNIPSKFKNYEDKIVTTSAFLMN